MRRFALLSVLCLILAASTGLGPAPALAEVCWPSSKSVVSCCGPHAQVDYYEGVCCQFTGCRYTKVRSVCSGVCGMGL